MSFANILLWLFVINLGIAFGAGLYEKRIILPQWFSVSPESGFRVNSEAMRQTDTGPERYDAGSMDCSAEGVRDIE